MSRLTHFLLFLVFRANGVRGAVRIGRSFTDIFATGGILLGLAQIRDIGNTA